MIPPKPVEKKFGTRKAVLLALPITVAFLVGGKAGSLVGIDHFMWSGAIGWALMIGIIDYNFSIMEQLSKIGWIGRIILIMTSAIITATIGDHIIFKDTIADLIDGGADGNPAVQRAKKEFDDKTIVWDKAVADIKIKNQEIQKMDGDIKTQNAIVESEINRGGCHARCEEKKAILAQLRLDKISKENDVKYLRTVAKDSKIDADEAKEDWNEAIGKVTSSHNIIEEIRVLYKLIFEDFSTMIIFILLSLMVICIETLPLLLKSGVTSRKEYEAQLVIWQRKVDAIKLKEAKELAAAKLTRSIILRNNRI